MNIVLPTYNRLDYLKRSLGSLLLTDIEEDCLWAYDDASSERGVKDFLLEHECPKFKIHFNERNLGCDHNVYQSIKKTFERTDDQFLTVTDPDAIYHPEWLSFIKRKLADHNDIGLLSVFNTENHPERGVCEDAELCEKKSVGGLALAINRDIFEKVDPNVILDRHSHFCWDWQCVTLCNKMGYKILCSKDSYVDHIGFVGVHSRREGQGDQAQNFLGEKEKDK